MYTDLELNLYTRLGDEDQPDTYFLSAYGRDEQGQLDTSNYITIEISYITIEISKSDYTAFTDDEDAWFGDGDFEYKALLETFVLYQLLERSK